MVLTVFGGIAEFERALAIVLEPMALDGSLAERTEDGRRSARRRGVAFGRPLKLRPDQQALARQLLAEGRSVSEVARTFNVHPATIYRCRDATASS